MNRTQYLRAKRDGAVPVAGPRIRDPKRSYARFEAFRPGDTTAKPLANDHPAVVEGRSVFRVTRPSKLGSHVLISGINQSKIGHRIVKGPWAGSPVYTLSLEERATCPRSCKVFSGCYGNAMPFAARWSHGPEFERALLADLFFVAGRHRGNGFAVRIHVLGDFYSTGYVSLWREALAAIPNLRVWGYTAWPRKSEMGRVVEALNAEFPDRWAVRFSGSETIVVSDKAQVGDAIICPAETGATANCGQCGLCFAAAARDKVIAFLFHGNPGRGRRA